MGRVVVDVMPKPEILDPQGKAVAGALPRLGFAQFVSVRQGKRFELEVDGPVTPEVLAAAAEAARQVLSNPVIEDVDTEGTLKGGPAPGRVKLTEVFDRLEFTHGHNVLLFTPLLRLANITPRIRPYLGVGAGLLAGLAEVRARLGEAGAASRVAHLALQLVGA